MTLPHYTVEESASRATQYMADQIKAKVEYVHGLLNSKRGSTNIQVREPGTDGKQYSWHHPRSFILTRTEKWYYLTWDGKLVVMHFEKHDDGSDHNYATVVELEGTTQDEVLMRNAAWIIRGLDVLAEKIQQGKL